MLIYALFVAIVLCFSLFVYNKPDGEHKSKQEKYYVMFSFLMLVIIAGLRGDTVGSDTHSYIVDYKMLATMPLSDVGQYFPKGTGYFFITRLFIYTQLSVHWWFAITEAFYCFAISRFISRYSNDKLFSVICFFTMGLFTFSLAGQKQVMSMAFSLLGFVMFIDKRYLMMILLYALGAWCHPVSIISLLSVALYIIQKSKLYNVILIAILVASVIAGSSVWATMLLYFNDDNYTNLYLDSTGGLTLTNFLFFSFLFILSITSLKKYLSYKEGEAKMIYGNSLLVLCFFYISTQADVAFRLSYFFMPYFMVLIPNSCTYKQADNRKLMKVSYLLLLLFFFFYTQRLNVYETFIFD